MQKRRHGLRCVLYKHDDICSVVPVMCAACVGFVRGYCTCVFCVCRSVSVRASVFV